MSFKCLFKDSSWRCVWFNISQDKIEIWVAISIVFSNAKIFPVDDGFFFCKKSPHLHIYLRLKAQMSLVSSKALESCIWTNFSSKKSQGYVKRRNITRIITFQVSYWNLSHKNTRLHLTSSLRSSCNFAIMKIKKAFQICKPACTI